MARPRSAGYDGQRERILANAARLFAARGYPATSMNEVAESCGLSKATLYHYYDDKYALLVGVAETHVSRLQVLITEVQGEALAPRAMLRELIRRLLAEYADAADAQRVLTAEARYLNATDARRVRGKERLVVDAFAAVVLALRPDLKPASLARPVTMLLFGMINWLFTWMKPDGPLGHDAIAGIVADLFLEGLPGVRAPARMPTDASG